MSSSELKGSVMFRAASTRRLEIGLALIVVFAFVVGALWIAKGRTSASAMESRPALSETMVECRDLNGSDMPPRETAKYTVIDAENGLLQISYRTVAGDLRTITVDYVNDQACYQLAEVREVIAHARDVERESRAQQCLYLRKAHVDGTREIKGRPIDRNALGRYIQESC